MQRTFTLPVFLFILVSAFGQMPEKRLKIANLTGDCYVFTTYGLYKGQPVPANGMYLLTGEGAVLIDSPWDTTQFQPLLDSIKAKHKQDVVMCLATHFHEDRTGGLEYYRSQGIRTYTSRQTDELSKNRGMKRAEWLINSDTVFTVGKHSFQTYFPGHGHTPDNLVVWLKKEKILYGGCLIKSIDDTDLGNLADASVTQYAATLKKLKRKVGKPSHIIPGHGSWMDAGSLDHSLEMAEQLKKRKEE